MYMRLKTSDKIRIQSNTPDNKFKTIDISDTVAIDTLEYNSYKEAEVAVEMYSLQNVRIEKHNGKYKLIPCSEAMDISGRHLKVGDKVHYGLFRTWEIVSIERVGINDNILEIRIKSGERKEFEQEYINNEGQCKFNRLKLGKINAGYIASAILASISDLLLVDGKAITTYAIMEFIGLCGGLIIIFIQSIKG